MKADFHIHSAISADSESPMEEMIEKGISLGLSTMCFTEHMDFEYQSERLDFEMDTEAYVQKFQKCREQYQGKMELLFGVELGLQPRLKKRLEDYLKKYPFDFVIGSSHLVNGVDPYFPAFYEGREEAACYQEYFQSIVENLKSFSEMDVYGHIDYVVRYGPNKQKYYSYEAYREVLDQILDLLVEKGVGLELNTAGFKYGLGFPNPHPDILKEYRRRGGEIITVGSDGHCPEHLGYSFDKVREILTDCGFRYYTVFRSRRPEFVKL